MSLFSDKQGQITIVLFIIGIAIIGLLVYVVATGVGNSLIQDLNSDVASSDDFGVEAKSAISSLATRNHQAWDNGFIFIAGFLLIAAFIGGATIRQSPVMLILMIITIFLMAYVGMNIVNFFEDLTEDTVDSIDFPTYYPKASVIMNNMALYLIALVFFFGLGVWASERIGL